MLGEAEGAGHDHSALAGMGKVTLVRALVKVLTREFVRMSDTPSLGAVLVVGKPPPRRTSCDLIQENAPNRDSFACSRARTILILPMAAVSAAMWQTLQNAPGEKIALRRQRMQIAACR